jgi:hypothetical protein
MRHGIDWRLLGASLPVAIAWAAIWLLFWLVDRDRR